MILSLGNKILRKVAKEESASSVWLKLEHLYMTKSPANRFHKNTRLTGTGCFNRGTFRWCHKIIIDLANIDIIVDEEYQAILLLRSLDASYANLKETMMYGKESLTLE